MGTNKRSQYTHEGPDLVAVVVAVVFGLGAAFLIVCTIFNGV